MVKFGLDSFSYHLHMEKQTHPWNMFWFLKRVVDLGLDGCQPDPMHLDRWNEDLVRAIGKFCKDEGLYLELGSGGFGFDHLAPRLELAAESGARVVRTFIGGERFETPEERLRELMAYTIENFKRLAGVAERLNIVLALENHEDLTSDEILEVLHAVESPYVRACVDTGNSLAVSEDPVECVRKLAPYAAMTHLKDWIIEWHDGVPNKIGCAFGKGEGKVAEVYPILRRAQPDMPITLEIATLHPEPTSDALAEEESNVVESIEFARELEASFEKEQG